MPTYPLPTLAPSVSLTGISAPTYSDIYQSLIASFQSIYGASIYVAPDSQDGQWLAILARAIHDSNQSAISIFQAFSPTYSQGVGLSSLVKLNGITRKVPTNSSATGKVVGQAGAVVVNGVVQDGDGNRWNLPASVTIPLSGEVTVTVTAQDSGALTATAGTINTIYNPQLGWQSFLSTTDAIVGAPVESDAELRVRQYASVATPAQAIKEAIHAAVNNVTGVTACAIYENDTGRTTAEGLPAHSVAIVVLGGDTAAVAAAIASRKPPGIQTFGSTTITVFDQYGLANKINFFILQQRQTYFNVTIKPLATYSPTTGDVIKQALSDFINSLTIGESVYQTQALAAAALINSPLGQTFYITSIALGFVAAPSGTATLPILFNQEAVCSPSNVIVTTV